MKVGDHHDEDDLDLVQLVLLRVRAMAPSLTQEQAVVIEQDLRARYGGLRARIAKRGKHLPPAQRQEAYKDALTDMPTPALLVKHKISLSTLKRLVKTGPGEGKG